MESFDKKLKDKFEDSSFDVPDEFSWENLGPGIMEQVEQPKKSRKGFYFLAFLAGFTFLAFSIYVLTDIRKEPVKELDVSSPLIAIENETKQQKASTEQNIIQDQHISNKQIEQRKKLTQRRTIEKSDYSTVSQNNSGQSTLFLKQQNSSEKHIGLAHELAIQNNKATKSDITKEQPAQQNQSASNKSSTDFGPQPDYKTYELSSINDRIIVQKQNALKPLYLKKPDSKQPKDPSNALRQSIGLSAGVVAWNMRSQDFDLLQNQTTLPSWGMHIQYNVALNHRINFSTGLEYSALRSRMTGIFTDVVEHYNEDAVQNVINQVTGEVHQQTGARERITTKKRIVHHNTYHVVAIPLDFTYSIPVDKRISIGGLFGVKGNTIITRSGRGITTENTLIEYNNAKQTPLFSLQASVGLIGSYTVSQHFSLQTTLRYNAPLNSVEWINEDSRTTSDFRFNVGFVYTL